MADDRVFLKCSWHLMPLMMLYIVNFVDRVNVGFAPLMVSQAAHATA